MGEFMTFSNYYLWFLIDWFGLIVDDIKELSTFTNHKAFEPFVTTFMSRRKIAI
jgi:hypothetical protein